MSVSAANIVGGLIGLTGCVKGLEFLDSGHHRVAQINNQRLSSKTQRITHAIGVALQLIGQFFIVIGTIGIGAFMLSAAPKAAFFTVVQEALITALPYLGAGFAAFAGGMVFQEGAR